MRKDNDTTQCTRDAAKSLMRARAGRRWPGQIDKNVEREVLNHKTLVHPNVVQFREVYLTEDHLGVVMEYASGGELFDEVADAGKLTEAQVCRPLPAHLRRGRCRGGPRVAVAAPGWRRRNQGGGGGNRVAASEAPPPQRAR